MEVTHDELRKWIKAHYHANETSNGDGEAPNMHIWGAPGIGKSMSVREAGRELAAEYSLEFSMNPKDYQGDEKKFVVSEFRASQLEPTDFLGLPDLSGEYTDWKPPRGLPVRGRGIIFLDEMNRASQMVRNALYSYLDSGMLGNSIRPKAWLCVAAGNRLEDKVGVEEMEMTLANRFNHYTLKPPTAQEWINNFAVKHNVHPHVIGFLSWKPGFLYDYKPGAKVEYAVATPRSWHYGSTMYGITKDADAVSAAVGEAIGTSFATFVSLMDELDIDRILAGEIPFPHDAQKAYAITTSIAEWYQGKKDRLERIFKYITEIPPEYGILCLTLTQHLGIEAFRKQIGEMLTKHKDVARRFGKYLW